MFEAEDADVLRREAENFGHTLRELLPRQSRLNLSLIREENLAVYYLGETLPGSTEIK